MRVNTVEEFSDSLHMSGNKVCEGEYSSYYIIKIHFFVFFSMNFWVVNLVGVVYYELYIYLSACYFQSHNND